MAVELLFTDGCDHYDATSILAKYSGRGGAGATWGAVPAGRGTTNGIRISNADYLYRDFANQSRVALGIAVYLPVVNAGYLLAFKDGTAFQCEIYITDSGGIYITRNGTTLQSNIGAGLQANQWHTLGLVLKVANAPDGIWQVTCDGTVVLSGTGDTQATANARVNRLQLMSVYTPEYFKDIYLFGGADAAYLGDRRVGYFLMNGAGNYSQWTQSQSPADANYQDIDDNPPDGDTTHNFSSTPGQKDSFAHSILSNAASIDGLMVWSYARKDDAGVRTLREFLRISGADYAGSSRNIGDAYMYYGSSFINNPASSPVAPFTPAEVDALEPGYELVA